MVVRQLITMKARLDKEQIIQIAATVFKGDQALPGWWFSAFIGMLERKLRSYEKVRLVA